LMIARSRGNSIGNSQSDLQSTVCNSHIAGI